MRDLYIEELNEVQGGSMLLKWAGRLVGAVANGITFLDAAMRIEFNDSANNSEVNFANVNDMGDACYRTDY